jgi:hypothetical protein
VRFQVEHPGLETAKVSTHEDGGCSNWRRNHCKVKVLEIEIDCDL